MAKEKEIKTNAMRILDRQKIKYEVLQYECDEFIDGLHTAEKTGAPVEQSFKTLVAQGKSKQYYVLVLPIAEEVDLKKAAKAVGEKSIEMLHVKDITAVSGYVRGGCSPIGMKKQYPTVIQECAAQFDKVYVSGGRIGTTLCMAPEAASGSMGFENSMQAACLPRAQTVNSTMPPVVEPMVIGRHSALPIMGFLYISALF